MTKVILGYTGKLDTSIALYWLIKEKKFTVIACSIQLGQPEYLNPLGEKAIDEGAIASYVVDAQEKFTDQYVFPVLHAQAEYEMGYNLCHALSRPPIAEELIRYADEEGCDVIALGCRGLGNDTLRFERCITTLAPSTRMIYPIKEIGLKNIEQDLAYARAQHIPTSDLKYDVDQNLWGRCITSKNPLNLDEEVPREAFFWTVEPEKAMDNPTIMDIEFQQGYPVKLNNVKVEGVKLLETLNTLGGRHGIGLLDIIENQIMDTKSREFYEIPAAVILLKSHRALEATLLDKELIHFKEPLSQKLAHLIYNGKWFTPLRVSISNFFESLRSQISGIVKVKLYKGNVTILRVTPSPHGRPLLPR